MRETESNNTALQDAILSRCTVPPPERMERIADAIGDMSEFPLNLSEIDAMVLRIFAKCNGSNDRPKPQEETETIIVDIQSMLIARIRDKRTEYNSSRLKGGSYISGI